jgi:dipeptidyl aminopeptidase/acylaminoacyl peptidase
MFDAEKLTQLRRVTATSPSPCGRFVAVAVQRLDPEESKYISDLWRVSLTEPGAPPLQLTRGASKDTSPQYRCDGALGFLSNRNPRDGKPQEGDEERSQVWLLPADGGEPVPLTDEPLGVGGFRFAAAVPRLFVLTDVLPGVPHAEQRAKGAELHKHGPSALHFDRMPVRFWDHWLQRPAPHVIAYVDGERRDLTPTADREHREAEWDVSADGDLVVITRAGAVAADGVNDVSLLVVDVATGGSHEVGRAAQSTSESPVLSPDGSQIACVRDERRAGRAPYPRLWLYPARTPEHPGRLLTSWEPWPATCCWTSDGQGVLVTADVRGDVPVVRVDVQTGSVSRLTSVDSGGSHGSVQLTRDGNTLVGIRHRHIHPPEPFRLSLRGAAASEGESAGAEPELLGRLSGFDPLLFDQLGQRESFEVAAPDGGSVQSFLLTPRGDGPHPLLLWVHGGPMNQWADSWHWRWNPLVPLAAGYAVLLPNPRGSTGFGQEFTAGIWNNQWGAACFRDVMAATDAVCARHDIDPRRMAVMGGSFGGYMANWIAGSTERFRCLVSHAGIYDFRAFHGVTDHPAWFAFGQGGAPEADPVTFNRYSPHTRLDHWRTPTLVVHGEKDYRVPISEALLLFEALQRRGVSSELLVFPDESHWILRPRNTRRWYEVCLRFLQRHLAELPSG